jgi:hypothetical protein
VCEIALTQGSQELGSADRTQGHLRRQLLGVTLLLQELRGGSVLPANYGA